MIEISITDRAVNISGHAGYAPPEKDIVCAAVSVLSQTLIESLERLTDDTITYNIKPGTVDINYRNLSERGKLLLDSFFVGVRMIAAEYPDNVKLS